MVTEIKTRELIMKYFVLGENKQVQKVSLKSVTMREKRCFIITENRCYVYNDYCPLFLTSDILKLKL